MKKKLRKNFKNSSNKWILRQINDPYSQDALLKGYRSRSAFKLIELDEKFKILSKDTLLLDLGSSPGGWSQVAAKKIKLGKILSVDIKQMKKIDNVEFFCGDFLDLNIQNKIANFFSKKINVVISDMASNITGNKSMDSIRTAELCLGAMEFSKKILKNDGSFLSKLFMGANFKEIENNAKKSFKKVIKYKPISSRKESRELYIFCKNIIN